MPFYWRGGALTAGSAIPTALIAPQGSSRANRIRVEGVDLSLIDTSNYVFTVAAAMMCDAVIRNCKLGSGFALLTGTITSRDVRAEMYNCDAADTNYRTWIEDYCGSIKSETTIVRTGGASDGTTTLSWVMASSANAEYPMMPLVSPEIVQWNETTGSQITATVEIAQDNGATALKDDEIWLEVQYLGTSGFPLASFVSDAKADVLASAANQTTSSETWGGTNPTKQKLAVSFTPQEKGFIHATVHLAKASTTVYVDPKITVS
jgi:hypothetical protein